MILVFILLGIIILTMLVVTVFMLSTLQIEIKNLKVGNKTYENKERIKDKYEIKICLYFLEKIPMLCIKLNNDKLNRISNNKQLEKINFKELEKKISFSDIKEGLKKIKLRITKLNLNINIGIEDAILTSYLTAFIGSIIGILLPHLAKRNINNCKYIVNPIYKDKNEYYISLESIIRIKIVHIIYSMLFFVKKGRDENERASNRRTYAYSNE